jgi:hypothetical protein
MSDEGIESVVEPVCTIDQRDPPSSSASTDRSQETLAQRRRIPTQKLKLYANMKHGPMSPTACTDLDLLSRLAEQNAQLLPQVRFSAISLCPPKSGKVGWMRVCATMYTSPSHYTKDFIRFPNYLECL